MAIMSPRNDRADREAFMKWALDKINAGGPDHPLAYLVDQQNHQWIGPRLATNEESPTTQAGHVVTRGYDADRYALEDPAFNVNFGGQQGEGVLGQRFN